MPDPSPTDPSPVPPTPADSNDLPPLVERATPEYLSELDAMNKAAGFGGAQPPSDNGTQPPVVPPTAETTPPVVAPVPPELPPIEDPDSILPPAAGTKPPEKAGELAGTEHEFPEGKTLFSDEAMGKLRTDKHKADVGALRENYDKIRPALSQAQARIAELEKEIGNPDEKTNALIEDLKQRNTQLNSIVEKHAIREHPWVQQNFTVPRTAWISRAEKAMELAGHKPEELRKALGMEGAERIAALDGIYESVESRTLRGQLEQAVSQIETIDERMEAFIANRNGEVNKLLAEDKARQQGQLLEQEKKFAGFVDACVAHLDKQWISFFSRDPRPEGANWNAALEADINEAKEIALKNTDPARLLSAIVLGVRANRINVAYQRVLQLYQAERAKNATRAASIPPVGGGRVPTDPLPAGQGGQRIAAKPGDDLLSLGRRAISEVMHGGQP